MNIAQRILQTSPNGFLFWFFFVEWRRETFEKLFFLGVSFLALSACAQPILCQKVTARIEAMDIVRQAYDLAIERGYLGERNSRISRSVE